MYLNGFGFSGYRSFVEGLSKISPLQKVNLIIGKNNTGKSNIVNFLNEQYPYFLSKVVNQRSFRGQVENVPFKRIDQPISNRQVVHKIAFPI